LTPEDVDLTATDTTAGVALQQIATITFATPPAASGGIAASPTNVLNDGASATTITVMLQDGLGRPTPGKEIRLSQGAGRSVITAPDPSVTGANGEIQFTATDQYVETVTYTAVDVTDGDLPVPGDAQVSFAGRAELACVTGAPPTGAPGYMLTPFANGFRRRPIGFQYGRGKLGQRGACDLPRPQP
jgi:hypothetical protein